MSEQQNETAAPHLPLGGILAGKRALITGVANERSIAWAIAEAFRAEGAELAFTYPGEAMGKRVRPLAEQAGAKAIIDLDVSKDEDVARAAAEIGRIWPQVDIVLHSIGYAPRGALDGRFTEVTTREAWQVTMDVSAYSLVALTRGAVPLFERAGGGSVMSLTFNAAEKVVPSYNVMAIAKAALEAETRYLAADLGPENIRVNTGANGTPPAGCAGA